MDMSQLTQITERYSNICCNNMTTSQHSGALSTLHDKYQHMTEATSTTI
jgi:hypothetical protein